MRVFLSLRRRELGLPTWSRVRDDAVDVVRWAVPRATLGALAQSLTWGCTLRLAALSRRPVNRPHHGSGREIRPRVRRSDWRCEVAEGGRGEVWFGHPRSRLRVRYEGEPGQGCSWVSSGRLLSRAAERLEAGVLPPSFDSRIVFFFFGRIESPLLPCVEFEPIPRAPLPAFNASLRLAETIEGGCDA
jgi:hypothetical protein